MIDDISGYKFEDLVAARIVKTRTDLARKQKETGFPMPVKLGKREAWFPRDEVHHWLSQRIAARPVPTREQNNQPVAGKPAKRRAVA